MNSLSPDQFFAALSAKARGTRSPESVTFELSYGCNLQCVHCYNPTHRALPQELATEEVCSILDQLADLGVVELHFSGGEPLIRPDALDIFRHAKRLGFVLYLISNATRITAPVADALQQLEFYSINVSLYGATQTTYERVTGIPGSYEPFLQGLQRLASRKLPVVVRMPVMTDNAHEVQAARTLVEGFGFKFQYCLDIMPKTNGDLGPLTHRLSPAEKVRIDSAMVGYRDSEPTAEQSCMAGTRDFIPCACGRSRFAITPYGEMNLCIAFPTPRYDLRSGTVREGWDVLKQTVDRARPNDRYECPACEVRPNCRQGRNDAWLETGDMSRCLPHFKEFAVLEQRLYERLKPRQTG
ncbi:MAG: radical SAM protein [Nitrospirales bacterium]|nr:radical SAM protein [Nitrospirales bacterium]